VAPAGKKGGVLFKRAQGTEKNACLYLLLLGQSRSFPTRMGTRKSERRRTLGLTYKNATQKAKKRRGGTRSLFEVSKAASSHATRRVLKKGGCGSLVLKPRGGRPISSIPISGSKASVSLASFVLRGGVFFGPRERGVGRTYYFRRSLQQKKDGYAGKKEKRIPTSPTKILPRALP